MMDGTHRRHQHNATNSLQLNLDAPKLAGTCQIDKWILQQPICVQSVTGGT
jgi:hypothetical protein